MLLAEYREKHDYSKRKLAARIGCSRSYIAFLMDGTHLPTINTFMLLAEAFGMTPAALQAELDARLQAFTEALPVLPPCGANSSASCGHLLDCAEEDVREKEWPEIIGKAIALRRREAGMTQAELAGILPVAPDALSRMENGRLTPKMGLLRNIAAALQCSVADLFQEADEKPADRASGISEIYQTPAG